MTKNLLGSVAAAMTMALGACAVGPDFHTPAAPGDTRFTPEPLVVKTDAAPGPGGEAQQFGVGESIPAQWWALFHNSALDGVVRESIANNPSLAVAQASLRAARENVTAGYSLLWPGVDLQANVIRERISGLTVGHPGFGADYTVYNPAINITYGIDVFGGARRAIEGLEATSDYQRYQVEATYLTLTANVVSTALREASVRAQIATTHAIADAESKELELVERQFALGAVPRATVLAQQTQVAIILATLPALEKSLAQTRHQLAILVGATPSQAKLPEFRLDELTLPTDIPVSLPSELVRQRPDILADEAQLHAASAQVGVATASMYPQIGLTASWGGEALVASQVFQPGNIVWSLAGGLTQPLFHAGELTAKRRAAIDAFEQAAAQYRLTVLTAFGNVADSLRALEFDATAMKVQADAASLAKANLELSDHQYRLGAVSHLALLDAQRQFQQSELNLEMARAERFIDTAALFQALGGGWWNRTEPLADAHGATD